MSSKPLFQSSNLQGTRAAQPREQDAFPETPRETNVLYAEGSIAKINLRFGALILLQ